MAKRGDRWVVRLALAGSFLLSLWLDDRLSGQEDAPGRADAMQTRDRLWEETQRLRSSGKLVEALTSAEEMIRVERQFLGVDDPAVARSLDWIVELYVEREDFAAASAARRRALADLRAKLGETHWKVIDARLALDDIERLSKMDRAEVRQLTEATALNRRALDLLATGDLVAASDSARTALATRAEILGDAHPAPAESRHTLALVLLAQGDLAAARPLLESALGARVKILGELHPASAANMHDLAYLLYRQGDYPAAKPLYDRAIAARREVLGERNADYCQSLHNLALLLEAQGDRAAARTVYERALALRREVLGERDPNYLYTLSDLGVLLMDQSDYAAASPLLERVLELRKEVLGERDLEYAGSLHDLGRLRYDQNEYAAAKPLYEKALALRKELLGEHNADYCQTLHNLGLLLAAQRDYAAARPVYERASALRKEVLGERDRDYLYTLNNLGVVLTDLGDYGSASPVLESAVALRKEVLGERDGEYARSLHNLGRLRYEQKDYAAAKLVYDKALALRKELLGEHNADYCQTLHNLGLLLAAQSDYAAARPVYERALALRKEVLGERDPDYLHTLHNLGHVLFKLGDLVNARPICERAVALRKEVLGERNSDYLNSLDCLASVIGTQEDFAAALPLLERVRVLRKEALGERDPEYLITLRSVADVQAVVGNYAAAHTLSEEVLALQKQIHGEHHADYARALTELGLILINEGDYSAARPVLERAVALRKELLGEHHPDYAGSLSALGLLFQSMGDYASARPLFEAALAVVKEHPGEHSLDYAGGLENLALVLNGQHEYATARPLLERATAIRKDLVGERSAIYALSLVNEAKILVAQEDFSTARRLLVQALEAFQHVFGDRHPGCQEVLTSLALASMFQRDLIAARSYAESAAKLAKEILGVRHRGYGSALMSLSLICWLQGDRAQATPLMEQSVAIMERNLDLSAGAQAERQQLAMARELRFVLDAYLSLTDSGKVADSDDYRHVLSCKGAVLERQRRLSSMRRRSQADPNSASARLFAELVETTDRLSTLALAVPDPKKADNWRQRIADLTGKKEAIEAELARLDGEFRAAHAEAQRGPKDLQATLPQGTALIDYLQYVHVEPTNEKGPLRQEVRMLAFVVRPDRPIIRIELGPQQPIATAVEGWRAMLRTPAAALDGPAWKLRSLVWEPLEPGLEGIKTVLVSPDGVLGSVPLAALPGKTKGTYLLEDRLIAVVPVPKVLGGGAPGPGNVGQGADMAARLLLAGDIDYGAQPGPAGGSVRLRAAGADSPDGLPLFSELSGTLAEVSAVRDSFARAYPQNQTLLLRRAEPTEEAIRRESPRARWLHLATHGYFAPAALRSAMGRVVADSTLVKIDPLGGLSVAGLHPGLLSGIVLAGADRRPTPLGDDDGILTPLEVVALDLSACDLAVLSACETGLGETAGGEGLLGLQRAFQVAGAGSVVASLWSVDDEPTQALMADFYENVWCKRLNLGEALRAAQLNMLNNVTRRDSGRDETKAIEPDGAPRGVGGIRKGSQGKPPSPRTPPFYWAAFVLSTDRP